MCLRPRRGCGCWCRSLLCSRRTCFGFLAPGEYVLTLRGAGRCLELLVRLPPGANVEVGADLARRCWCWRRDRFRYSFNQA
ncbi:hypothetical protein [Intestinimonas massiliensis (ex Afouda et al. 2020)]|uniref:hypothetical protein n=1 Tax=Intestinimonas massiliensis (ex Afouda et al. 2020) TaxID=1673721 RepID=UPI001030E266|nr:hypothetical protein [Intestinimonas massiliensis (ex Afouda et al. 2020)]